MLFSTEAKIEIQTELDSLVERSGREEAMKKSHFKEVSRESVRRRRDILQSLQQGILSYESKDQHICAFVHPDTRGEYAFQISYFDAKGPLSHSCANRVAEGICSIADTLLGSSLYPAPSGPALYQPSCG